MQALACSTPAAGTAVHRAARRGGLAGRQLRAARSNGVRCRAFFKFGKKKDDGAFDSGVEASAEYFKGVARDDFLASDVEDYFMYMGMLASEGNYDRCEAMLASGTHPCDLLLLMACSEGDDGKVNEMLKAGANPNVKDIDGKSAMDLATKEEIKELLRAANVTA